MYATPKRRDGILRAFVSTIKTTLARDIHDPQTPFLNAKTTPQTRQK